MTLRERLDNLDEAFKGLAEAIEAELNPSILKGKVAIQVNNEREFKLLMENYDAKRFKPFNKNRDSKLFLSTYNITSKGGMLITHVAYGDGYGHSQVGYYDVHGYKIIPFVDFASEVGIKVPVKIMVSEDGVDLYDKDPFYIVCKNDGKYYLNRDFDPFKVSPETPVPPANDEYYFSTKEAAEKWIKEQNKPVAIDVRLFNQSDRAVVVKTGVTISVGGVLVTLAHSDIEDIAHAIQSLQCDTNKS